jgi:hypothetical protein
MNMLWSAIRGAPLSSPFNVSLTDIKHQRNASLRKVYPNRTGSISIIRTTVDARGQGRGLDQDRRCLTLGSLRSTHRSRLGFLITPSQRRKFEKMVLGTDFEKSSLHEGRDGPKGASYLAGRSFFEKAEIESYLSASSRVIIIENYYFSRSKLDTSDR